MEKAVVIGIESTAHTFGVGIIEGSRDEFEILADIRKRYSPDGSKGIEPFEAAEHHSKYAVEALSQALDTAGLKLEDVDAVSFSRGPGLGPCLRVGAALARFISLRYGKPLYPVHHGIGHLELVSSYFRLTNPLHLLVSGGHTTILRLLGKRYRVYGETLDITVGNLLDVFARELGLPFPGGPIIEELAKKGSEYIELPYSIRGTSFQFSGMLTKAISLAKNGYRIEDIAYSLQETAFSLIVEALERALTSFEDRPESIAISGGVASNDTLYRKVSDMASHHDISVYRLPKKLNSDNGVQIAIVGLRMLLAGIKPPRPSETYVIQRWRIDEVDVEWI